MSPRHSLVSHVIHVMVRVELISDSRLDLFNRRLKEQSARLRSRAVELIPKGLRTPKVGATSMEYEDREGEGEEGTAENRRRGKYTQDVEREVDRIKVKVSFLD